MDQKGFWLRRYFLIFGLLNTFIISFPAVLLGDVLFWQPRNIPTELMLASLHFGMGVVMLAASRKPLAYKGFVDFLIIANTLHGLVMVITAQHPLHLADAALVGLMGILPMLFYPWGLKHFLSPVPLGEIT